MALILHAFPYPPPEDPLTLLPPSLMQRDTGETPEHGILCLDSGGIARKGSHNRWTILCPRPKAVLRLPFLHNIVSSPALISDTLWQELRLFWHHHRPASSSPRSTLWSYLESQGGFMGGMIGMISAEAGLACEGLATRHESATPSLVAMICTDFYLIDREEQRLYWIGEDHPPPIPAPLSAPLSGPILPYPSSILPDFILKPDMAQPVWEDSVRHVQDFIIRGDIFQANLTMRWQITPAQKLSFLQFLSIYRHLRRKNPAPFGAFMAMPGFVLLSASVERFLSLSAEGQIETRPIKGTAPLSAPPESLAEDDKERAENIMITDLMRHDIGRVCALGSVNVPQLCHVERFAHLYHLVSCVRGQLRKEYDAFDLLAATLPPGSVTGAPKHRALEIIDQIETSPRGAYCGTLFRLGWNGALESSVLIRSLSATPGIEDSSLFLGAGGGITFPSDPRKEYEEMCLKAAPLLDLFTSGSLS